MTTFEVDEVYPANFEVHKVGSSQHLEYWIPAAELDSFNNAIRGLIRMEKGFFGQDFTGHIPDAFGLKDKDAVAQFVALYRTWDYSSVDVTCEISANQKSVFLNWMFWLQHDFSEFGINQEQGGVFLVRLKQVWESSLIQIPLPPHASRSSTL